MLAAIPRTVSGATPIAPPPAKASPESFRSTRSYDGTRGSLLGERRIPSTVVSAGDPGSELGLADLEAGERGDVRARLLEDLRHGLLVVLREGLLLEDGLLEEP